MFDVPRDHAVGQLNQLQVPFQVDVGIFYILCLFHNFGRAGFKMDSLSQRDETKNYLTASTLYLSQLSFDCRKRSYYLLMNGNSTNSARPNSASPCFNVNSVPGVR